MPGLAKKTTILFNPEEYELLRKIAHVRKCSIGELIRTTLRENLGIASRQECLAAVKSLSQMTLPVANWEEMEHQMTDEIAP